jgi:hypothetical protein
MLYLKLPIEGLFDGNVLALIIAYLNGEGMNSKIKINGG